MVSKLKRTDLSEHDLISNRIFFQITHLSYCLIVTNKVVVKEEYDCK